jgi:hypothetical protein
MNGTANLTPRDATELGVRVVAHCLTVLPPTRDAIIDAVLVGWLCHLGKQFGEQTADQRSDKEDPARFCHWELRASPFKPGSALFVDHLSTVIGITRRLALEACSRGRTA